MSTQVRGRIVLVLSSQYIVLHISECATTKSSVLVLRRSIVHDHQIEDLASSTTVVSSKRELHAESS